VRRDLPDLTRWLLPPRTHRRTIALDWTAIDMDRTTAEIDFKVFRIKDTGLWMLERARLRLYPERIEPG
jgi:hypothetical protein